MKITVSTKDLKDAIKKINKFKVKSPELRILENTLLIADDDILTLINSNMKTTLKVTISCDIEEKGEILISQNDLKLISKIKENYIKFEDDKITTEKKNLKILLSNTKDYPKISKCNISQWVTTKDDIDKLLEVSYAIDKYDTRPILTGIYINKNRWVACDGFRLSVREGNYKSNVSTVIASKQVDLLKKLIVKNTGNIEFLTDDKCNYSSFKFDNVEIINKNIEGEFFKYENVIPEERENYIKVNKKEILEELDFVKEVTNSYDERTPMKLTNNFKKNELILNCSTELNTLNTKISILESNIDNKLDDNFSICFKPQYLEEAIKSHKDDEELYIIYGNSNVNPAIVVNNIDSNNLDLVLPVRMNKAQ